MNILIFGAGSYIGEHYREALEARGHKLTMVDAIKVKPSDIDFTGIDTVINVAGIAHIKITPDMENLFYKVNTNASVFFFYRCFFIFKIYPTISEAPT